MDRSVQDPLISFSEIRLDIKPESDNQIDDNRAAKSQETGVDEIHTDTTRTKAHFAT